MNRFINIFMACLLLAGVYCVAWLVPPRAEEVSGTETKDSFLIVIDPGHGGSDPGKVSDTGLLEKDINLEIALLLKEELDSDYRVILTRESDMGLYSENDTNKKASDMRERCRIIEEEKADMLISIHQNSYTDPDVKGAQVFYYTHSAEGKKLAESIQNSIKEIASPDNNRVSKSNNDYYMLLHTSCPAVIVECGFLSNPGEAELLNSKDYRKLIVSAIRKGIDDYLSEGKI
ncbi:MAG: N-acetylmuramoyl-L-alanine amidase [Butyrivibrio sp.]